jgi:hypothetical protein
MPTYKVIGIYSFAENLKNVKLYDHVILKSEKFNIQSKNAIGIYSLDNNKLGYLPIESKNEIKSFNDAYKISKLILNQDYPLLEISRYYSPINYFENIEYPFEKKIKYEYKLVNISKDVENAVTRLTNYLKTKKIKVKRSAVIYVDDNFINILIEIAKGFEQFETVTIKYFKDNLQKYEEICENGLIDNIFFRELMIYRIESYFEKNYLSILDYPVITNINLLKLIPTITEIIIHDPLEIQYKKVDIFLLIKLYFRYLLTNNDYYLLKYINIYLLTMTTDLIDGIKQIINNFEILDNILKEYNLKIGNFYYDHQKKIFEYIDFINEDTVFIIDSGFKTNHLYTAYLTSKENIIIYNPIEGNIYKINGINLSLF